VHTPPAQPKRWLVLMVLDHRERRRSARGSRPSEKARADSHSRCRCSPRSYSEPLGHCPTLNRLQRHQTPRPRPARRCWHQMLALRLARRRWSRQPPSLHPGRKRWCWPRNCQLQMRRSHPCQAHSHCLAPRRRWPPRCSARAAPAHPRKLPPQQLAVTARPWGAGRPGASGA